jgi:hypothetical protein
MVLQPYLKRVLLFVEEKNLKPKTIVKKQAKTEKADLLDWLLAIDASLT